MDRVDLTWEFGVRRLRKWRNKATAAANVTTVTFGHLADGRWFAKLSNEPGGAWVSDATELGKTLALNLAYRWMRDAGGTWHATPAAFDANGAPLDGLPWVRRGGEWFLEPDVS